MAKISFLYNPRLPEAEPFARELVASLAQLDVDKEIASVWDDPRVQSLVAGSVFVVALGGDGTVLRAARIAVPLGVPLVGVNLGKLGFLTELSRHDAAQKIPQFLRGECWVEERAILAVELHRKARPATGEWVAPDGPRVETYLAVNEVVAGRATLARAVDVEVWIEGIHLTHYLADGVIVATPTGSTAYSLAAGGAVLHPQLDNLLVLPILPHLGAAYPFVCPSAARIQLAVSTSHQASVTIDGQLEMPLYNGDLILAYVAAKKARFLRMQPRTYFYRLMSKKLRPNARKNDSQPGTVVLPDGEIRLIGKKDASEVHQ